MRDPKHSSSKLMDDQDLEPVLAMSKSHNPEDDFGIKLKNQYKNSEFDTNVKLEEIKLDGIGELPNQIKPRFSKPDNLNVEGIVASP